MSCSASVCAACRGPMDVSTEIETLCRACTDTIALLSQDHDDDDDQQEAAVLIANDDGKPTAACCPACQGPTMSRGPVSLCHECSEAVRICAECDFSDEDLEETRLNNCHDPPEKLAHQALSDLKNGNSPRQQAEEAIVVSVKTPGKLIQEKFLAACAKGDVVDLVFSPSPGSPVRVLVDVRTPVKERNRYLTNSAIRVREDSGLQSPLMPISSSTPRSSGTLDEDEGDEDCQIIAVIPVAHQIQDRIQQAEASGNVILVAASQDDVHDHPEATNQIHSTVDSDDEWISISSPVRKRPAPSSVEDVGATTASGNPQGGLSPPMKRAGEIVDC